MLRRLSLVVLLLSFAATVHPAAAASIPFRGTFVGDTVSATPVSDTLVFVVTEGSGEASLLGRYAVTIPHFAHLDSFALEGKQIFTAANGDTLTAEFTGELLPNAEGCLSGNLNHVVTGGTGRFTGASGAYVFALTACPAAFGFHSTATFDGFVTLSH